MVVMIPKLSFFYDDAGIRSKPVPFISIQLTP